MVNQKLNAASYNKNYEITAGYDPNWKLVIEKYKKDFLLPS